jgi:hypothetical protein
MYEELTQAAHTRADEIVAEARQEAHRIVADARHHAAALRLQQDREGCPSEAAINALRMEVAAIVRCLPIELQYPEPTSNAPELPTPVKPLAADSDEVTGRLVSGLLESKIVRESESSDESPGSSARPRGGTRDHSPQGMSRSWAPPEWISAE